MLKKFGLETLLMLTVLFMAYYPPEYGIFVFGLTLAAGLGFKAIDMHEAPDLKKLKLEVKELIVKVEQLILRGNR